MKIFILGASGYVGKAITQKLSGNYEVYGTYHSQKETYQNQNGMLQYDLCRPELVGSILDRIQPQIVISCLRGDFQNQLAAHNRVADYLCRDKTREIIYISTSNVFDARKEKPHYEMDQTGSETDYGNFKIKCEQMLQKKLGSQCVIVRIPQIWGKDCPRTLDLIENIKSDIPIETYPNYYVNYTTDAQVAEWIEFIIKKRLHGIFHIGTQDTYDYMQFQAELSGILGLKQPRFEKEAVPQRCYQAVLPGREEIPKDLQRKVADVLAYLEKTNNDIA